MDEEPDNGEELIGPDGRNATQRQMDEDGVEDAPVDAEWPTEEDDDLTA